MFAPRPPLPHHLFFLLFYPPTFHKITLSVSLSSEFLLLPPFPPPSFHHSLFLYSHCYLDCMPQRRTKWLASLFLCSLFAVSVMFVPPEGKTNKQTKTTGWVQIWSWGFSLQQFSCFISKYIYIYFLLDSSSYWPDPDPVCRTNCRCKTERLSDRIGTEPVWSTRGLVSQRDSLIDCSFLRFFKFISTPLPSIVYRTFRGAGRRWGQPGKTVSCRRCVPHWCEPWLTLCPLSVSSSRKVSHSEGQGKACWVVVSLLHGSLLLSPHLPLRPPPHLPLLHTWVCAHSQCHSTEIVPDPLPLFASQNLQGSCVRAENERRPVWPMSWRAERAWAIL